MVSWLNSQSHPVELLEKALITPFHRTIGTSEWLPGQVGPLKKIGRRRCDE
jgi:hypothetical protein